MASIDSMVISFGPNRPGVMAFQPGSGQFLFPLSGTYISIGDPTASGNDYIYNIADLNAVLGANGLPGVLDLSTNHFKLKFNMVLNPSFTKGDHVQMFVDAQSICGQTISGIRIDFDPSVGFTLASSAGLTSDAVDSWSAS